MAPCYRSPVATCHYFACVDVHHNLLSKRNPVLVTVVTCANYLFNRWRKTIKGSWLVEIGLENDPKQRLRVHVCNNLSERCDVVDSDFHISVQCNCYPSVC